MCGIAGFFGPGNVDDLKTMMRALAHRGPDGEGLHKAENHPVFLGHRRLSIVDLADGHQPMHNETRDVWVTFNGEIYNHQSLRSELEAKGHVFSSDHSDTEVLVHGWEEWGEDLPLKLNGMFGFCIWDQKKQVLFLARDRFGEKPLFWGQQGNLFVFGSELSVFQAHSSFETRMCQRSLKKYFAHAFIPAPNSLLENCFKLKPGHHLLFDLKTMTPKISSFWRFEIVRFDNPPSFEEAAEEIETLLLRSIDRRLMSDVSLGVFLSGGVDSSSVAAGMCKLRSADDVNSFAIGFKEKSFDESLYARQMADALGCQHREDILDLNKAKSLIPEILSMLDEPMGDGSLLPTYMLCQFARKNIKVALSGDAGDELFAGYDPFKALKLAQHYQAAMPKFAHKGMKALVDLLPKSEKNMSLDFKLRRVLMGLDYGPELWNPVWMSPLTKQDISDLFREPTDIEDIYSEVLELWNTDLDKSILDKSLEYYTTFYLPDDILTKVDRASMMNGLETRAVFLDNDLVNFVRKLPAEYKYDGKTTKKVLKRAVSRLVPQDILNRKKKGFGVPMNAWLKDIGVSADQAEKVGLSKDWIKQVIADHRTGKLDHRLFLWNWNVLQQSLSKWS